MLPWNVGTADEALRALETTAYTVEIVMMHMVEVHGVWVEPVFGQRVSNRNRVTHNV